MAAGALIVEEAGGKVSDLSLASEFLQRGEIIAYTPTLQAEAEKVSRIFSQDH
jgi:fructose-1,6-bisphosphatase/inositol monophosphatase family enzyme